MGIIISGALTSSIKKLFQHQNITEKLRKHIRIVYETNLSFFCKVSASSGISDSV